MNYATTATPVRPLQIAGTTADASDVYSNVQVKQLGLIE